MSRQRLTNADESPPWLAFAASAAVYAGLLLLGPSYALDTPALERPMLLVIALYTVAGVLNLLALWRALRSRDSIAFVGWVFGTSLVLRLLLLPTPPFQEIDIYRYLWDGVAVVEGVDPYAYPPQTIVDALDATTEATDDTDLRRLVDAARHDAGLNDIVRTIHYAELPSPYPPVSQAVFALAAATSGDGWSAEARLVWLKVILTAFDMATLAVVLWLLPTVGMHRGWAIAYGWCPLVIKEIAGSGHLDAIATFLATAAVAMAVGATSNPRRAVASAFAASTLLGLGVGAKLFPVVLAPLLAITFWRRLGVRATTLGAAAFVTVSVACLAPMFAQRQLVDASTTEATSAAEPAIATALPPPPGMEPGQAGASTKTAGLAAFLQSWEMNDLLFMVAYENLRWHDPSDTARRPWFDATPNAWSAPLRWNASLAFAITRGVSLAVFFAIAVGVALRSSRRTLSGDAAARGFLNAAFLTLAWFWLLAPTQNPWYWCWALPLVAFARSRAWLAVAPLAFGYYLRFWFESRFPETGVAGTSYDGEYFFYFVVPWFEFGPILLWLAVEVVLDRRRARCRDAQTSTARSA